VENHKIAIFASGNGTNAVRIITYFQEKYPKQIECSVWSNKTHVPVLDKAEDLGVKVHVFSRKAFSETNEVLQQLKNEGVTFIVLAGFLWLMPKHIIETYPQRVVNIHPSLLPKYGGKGMYGMKVHQAIKRFDEAKTGMTIHYVNEDYDDGEIIFQAACPVIFDDTPKTIARRVHILEHAHYPKVIEKLLLGEKVEHYHVFL